MTTTVLEPRHLVEFLDDLRESGWEISVEQYVAAENVLLAFDAIGVSGDGSPATWLSPIICGTAAEQELFHDRFGQWWHRRVAAAAGESEATPGSHAHAGAPVRQASRVLTVPFLIPALSIVLVVAIVALVFFSKQETAIPSDPAPSPVPVSPNVVTESAVPAPSIRAGLPPLYTFLPALPALVFGIWYLHRRRGPSSLRRLQTRNSLREIELRVTSPSPVRPEFRQVAQKLRKHRVTQTAELSPGPTIEATLRDAGRFNPVYAVRYAAPEYLVLVDSASRHDQQARFQNEIVDRLIADGVFVDRYQFDRDPRTCWMEGTRLTLHELVARHHSHVLIVFTDADAFVHPLTGATQRWLDLFKEWPDRAVLTPVAPSQWGYRESVLRESGFVVCPATPAGVAAFVEAHHTAGAPLVAAAVDAVHTPELLRDRPTRWVDDSEPDRSVVDQLCRDLRSALGDSCFLWLAACAVYPILHWELTLYLGRRLCPPSSIDAALVALVRLPWFRYGRMPDWLRLRLISELAVGQETQVRQTLQELLLSSLAGGDAEVALRFAYGPQKRARRRLQAALKVLLRRQPDDSPLNDYVFLSFLVGHTPRKLTLTLPDLLRRLFLTRGHWSLGLRPTAALMVTLVFTVFAWQPVAMSQAAVSAFRDANLLFQQQDYRNAAAKYEEALAKCRGTSDRCSDSRMSAAYFYLANSYDNQYSPVRRGEADNDQLLEKAIANYRIASQHEQDSKLRTLALQYLARASGPERLGANVETPPVIPSNPAVVVGGSLEATEQFTRGLEARDDRRWHESMLWMRRAILIGPEESTDKVGGILGRSGTEYLPYYFLGDAMFNIGDCSGAVNAWSMSEAQGVVQKAGPEFLKRLQNGYLECEKKGILPPSKFEPAITRLSGLIKEATTKYASIQSFAEANPDIWKSNVSSRDQFERAKAEIELSRARYEAARTSRLQAHVDEAGNAVMRARTLLANVESGLKPAIDAPRAVQDLVRLASLAIANADALSTAIEGKKAVLTPAMTAAVQEGRDSLGRARERLNEGRQTLSQPTLTAGRTLAMEAQLRFRQVLEETMRIEQEKLQR